SKFFGKAYKVYMETGTVGWQNLSDMSESEPNGGGDCGEPNNTITLGRNWLANVDGSGCLTDEFHLSLSASDFNAAGDTLFIYLSNLNGDYSDHRIYGIWSASAGADIVSQLKYQTYTDFTNMPSGQGSMNFENFKPNTGNAATTWLTGDWDWLWFFYDYDQSVVSTQNALNSWVEWLWTNVGIRGYRMDAVKHFDYAYTGDLYDYLHGQGIDPGMVVGEFFDTNAGTLKAWIDNVQANMNAATKSAINVRAFDFSLRAALKEACDNAFYDVRNVFNAGIVDAAGGSGFNVITFLNNHDYRDAGQPIQNDPILGYAYILTNNQIGIPCVFYPEYFGTTVPNYPTVNLQAQIDALIAAHKTYIFGATHREYLSRIGTPFSNSYTSGNPDETLFFQLHGGVGGKEVLVCINFSDNALNMTHQINSDLDGDGNDNFPVGQTFSEVFSYSSTPTLTANSNYEVNIQLPAKSYSVWVEGSVLPLDLVAFNANAQPDRVELNWETAFEADFEGFEIQKALNAAHFKPIGFVEAKAPQNGGAQYTFFDADPVFDRPMYYRLKMKDLDGQFQYSKTVAVEMNEPVHSLALRPNPVKGPAILSFNAQTEGTATLQILDTFGQVLGEQNLEILPGINEIPLALDNLPEGLYFLKMTLENGAVFIQKFVKSV
ncbi:MAG: T9SS C-terminal target domain-containing protein, partial [Bacteroidetes bacterium]